MGERERERERLEFARGVLWSSVCLKHKITRETNRKQNTTQYNTKDGCDLLSLQIRSLNKRKMTTKTAQLTRRELRNKYNIYNIANKIKGIITSSYRYIVSNNNNNNNNNTVGVNATERE